LSGVFGTQANASMAVVSDVIWAEENYSMAQEAADAASSGSIEVDQAVAKSFQGNVTGIIQGGQHQMMHFSSGSNSASFSRHLMCKDHELYINGSVIGYNPIDPTTIFRPSDIKAEILTTVSLDNTIEFRWYYRSKSSKTWVSCYNFSKSFPLPGEYHYAAWLLIAGYWPGSNYPRAYMVEVYSDGSPLPSFSEFFEVTNGGLNSPRISEDVDVNGHPVNMKSRFTIGNDTEAYHSLRFDKIAYFNNETGYSHKFTTVWIQPNGSTYKTYSGNFTDYKDTNVTWNYWEYHYTQDDYISINSSTPVGNWKVEVYLDSYFNNTWMPYGPIATTPFIVGNKTVADWTFMVYLDADNNLERPGIEIFLKMANVSSSSKVNVVVQMDRHPSYNSTLGYDDRYGNWTDAKRFNVTEGMKPTPENAVMNLTEVNMGDPDTLKDFVNWTINNYPANYYFLVLWDHGTGFVGISYDFTNATDCLVLPELSQALSGLPAMMDIVFLDACSMSMTEVAYQIKDYANVLVGPEGLGYAMVDSRATPYDDYLSSLTSNSSMMPNDFAKEVVTDYIDWCNSEVAIQNATISATDLTRITSLMAAIDNFALKLKEKETLYHDQISLARNLTAGYVGPYGDQSGYYIDLYHFAQLTNQYVIDEELQNTTDQVMTTLESIIIIEADKDRPDSHGLSIFFPDEKGKYDSYGSEYEETTFAEDTPWDEFVIYHLDIQTGYAITIQTPYPYIPVKVDEQSKATDAEGKIQVFALLDQSYNISVPTLVETGPGSRGNFTRWDNDETNSSRTITVTGSTTYTAYYETQYEVTFSQSGVSSNFTETIVTIDEEYNATNLPVSFWWDNATTHTFAFQSPLVVTPNAKRYVWNSTSGLSSLQIDPFLTVSEPGSVIGNYKTQFYLTLATSTPGGTTPSGEGWYYNGTDAPISTVEFVDITPGASRYRFNGWTTTDMPKISDKNSPSTTVRMDKEKTITANYVTQYYLTVISPYSSLTPTSGWFDSGTPINASVTSPWSLGATDTRYVCTGWTGTGSVPMSGTTTSVTFMVDEPSTITWNWETQYLLTVRTDPTGLDLQPNVFPPGPWYDNGTLVTCTAQGISGRVFDHWTVDGASWDPGVNQITVTMDGPHEVAAHYVHAPTWWETLFNVDMVNIYIGLVGFVVLPFALIGIGWFMTRRKRIAAKSLMKKIDEVYSKSKMSPRKCEEELHRLKNTILEDLTDGKITQESYDIMDKKIEECLKELRKQ